MVNVIQYILDSIAYGSLFALMALGLALLFSVMGLMNFAYGELIMASGYTMYYTQSWGVVPMIITTLIVATVLSVLMELIAFRPLRRGTAVTLLVTSFAVSFALQSLGWMTVGRGPQKAVSPYPYLTTQFHVAGVRISKLEIITWIAAAVVLIGMTLLLKRTRLGIQLRASTEDFRMAQLVGVRANRVISSAFALTGIIAGVVAILYIFRTGAVAPDMGQGPLFVAFVGAVIGGLGSLTGAALGGFALGAIIDGLEAALPRSVSSYTELFAFVAVVIILVALPDGLVSIRTGLFRRLRAPRGQPAPAAEVVQS
jgi:branched-chain amino acid transport system permease protein